MKKLIFLFLFIFIKSNNENATSENISNSSNTTKNSTSSIQKKDNETIVYSLNLNPTIFQETLDKYLFSLVDFYSPRCRHCKDIEPNYENLAKEINLNSSTNSTYLISRMDDGKYYSFDQKFAVIRYPSILLFHRSKKIMEYKGNNTESEWKKFLFDFHKNISNPFNTVEQVENILNTVGCAVLFYGDDENNKKIFEQLPPYEGVVKNFIEGNEIINKYNIKKNSVIVLKAYDERKAELIIDNNLTLEKLKSFVEEKIKIYLRRANKDLYLRGYVYRESSCYLYTDFQKKEKSEKEQDELREAIKIVNQNEKVNEEKKEKMLYVVVDVSNKDKESADLTLARTENRNKLKDIPALICHEFSKNEKFYYEEKDFKKEKIAEFIGKFINGEIKYIVEAPKVDLYEDDL